MSTDINTVPRVGLLRFTPRPIEHESIPLGSRVRLPTGGMAVVVAYRGFKRQHRVRLVCRYLKPLNKAFGVVLVLPELVEVVNG